MINIIETIERYEEISIQDQKTMLCENANVADALAYYGTKELYAKIEQVLDRTCSASELETLYNHYVDDYDALIAVDDSGYGQISDNCVSISTTNEFQGYIPNTEFNLTEKRAKIINNASDCSAISTHDECYYRLNIYNPMIICLEIDADTIEDALLASIDHSGYGLDIELSE